MIRRLLLGLAVCAAAAPAAAQAPSDYPAGLYRLDPSHASVAFDVDHLGLSAYTAGFDALSGRLELDPSAPETARLEIVIDVASLDLPSPPDGFLETMLGPDWFDAAAHPHIRYVADRVVLSSASTGEAQGRLTLRGETREVPLQIVFNGGAPAGLFEPHARLGFSATATLKRSDFGMTTGLPAPGSSLGVGDAVRIRIETEWTGPPAAK